MRSAFKAFAPWGVAAFLIGAGIGFGSTLRTNASAATSYEHLRIFAEVLTMIQNYYVEEKTPKELAEGAIKGLLRTLDPHSSYMDPEAFKNRREETAGKFGGLGIEITVRDSFITIVAPIEGTPADKAGLQAGDKIVKIDGVTTQDMSLMDAVKRMRGKIGTDVTITIFREEAKETFDVTITRGLIKIKSVKFAIADDEVGYVRIFSFTQDTSKEVRNAIEKLMKNDKFKGLVLDVRNNPGGLLNQAVEVSALFLDAGKTIVSTRGRTPDQNIRRGSTMKGPFTDFPVVVLINAGSASASEIVAGALQDLKRAVLVGTTSFGKGSVQTIRALSDGSGLSLTTARYYTPSGRMIHEKGIKPDIEVKLIREDGDDEAAKPMREKELVERFKKEKPDEKAKPHTKNKTRVIPLKNGKKIFDLERDNVLKRGVELIKAWDVFQDIKLKDPDQDA